MSGVIHRVISEEIPEEIYMCDPAGISEGIPDWITESYNATISGEISAGFSWWIFNGIPRTISEKKNFVWVPVKIS